MYIITFLLKIGLIKKYQNIFKYYALL